ncbi:hypothetical protein GCM10010517_61110 [Streptosporangium fragile]|uniref:RDD domain-containing protein n=1 Tax=Streptosporangium fragile TaxID=46186 RepID=A0ABP6INM7_9ACTN
MLINLADTLWIFAGSERRCLHDVITGTVVVDLADSAGKGLGRPGFLFGLGATAALSTTLVLVYVLMAR